MAHNRHVPVAGNERFRYPGGMDTPFTVEIGGATIRGGLKGTGPSLLCLHAGVADTRMWRAQMDGLADTFQVIAYDRRGFGVTVTSDAPFSHIADLKAVIDHLGVREVSLVGASQGGRVAVDFALVFPERVRSLFLIGPALSGAPVPDTFPTVIRERLDRLDAAEEADDIDAVNDIEAILWLDGAEQAEGRVSGPLRDTFLAMNRVALEAPELTREREPESAMERLGALAAPTCVIWGALDFPHIRERCRRLVDALPNAWGREIPGAAHLPNYERPEVVNPLIRTHCGEAR